MAKERTLAIIKPEAIKYTGEIIVKILERGFRIVDKRVRRLTLEEAADFYAEHASSSIFEALCDCMSSGLITALVLEKEDAIAEFRKLMGAGNPKEAEKGTLRYRYAFDLPRPQNAVHGSDSAESALREIKFFFPDISETTPRLLAEP